MPLVERVQIEYYVLWLHFLLLPFSQKKKKQYSMNVYILYKRLLPSSLLFWMMNFLKIEKLKKEVPLFGLKSSEIWMRIFEFLH